MLNAIALVVFCALFYLTLRRGATDPVCGMTVDRSKALTESYAGRTYYFCSEDCRARFREDPERYVAAAHEHALVPVSD